MRSFPNAGAMQKGTTRKKYILSYVLGGILIAAAFVTFLTDIRFTPMKDRNGSWVLFIGGMALSLVGWREHKEALSKRKE